MPPDHDGGLFSPLEKRWIMKLRSDFEKHRFSVIDRAIPTARDSSRALDIGCAIGVFTNLLRQKGYGALGVDTSEELLAFARRRYPHCTFKFMDALHLDLASSSFDFVLALEIIEHLDDPCKMLKSIHKLLKEGGTVLLSTPNRFSLEGVRGVLIESAARINWDAWDIEHKHVYTSIEITRLLQRFFKIEEVVGYYYVPMIPSMKYDVVNRIGLDKAHYLAFDDRILSMLGFITLVKGVKRKLDSTE